MKRLFLLLIFCSTQLNAQSKLIDSLKVELTSYSKADSLKMAHYLQLSEAYVYYDRDSMLSYALKGKELALKLKEQAGYLYALQREGVYYYVNLQLDTAMKIFNEGLSLSKKQKNLERQSSFEGSIGIAKYQLGELDSGIYYLESALRTDQLRADTLKMIVRLNNLGAVELANNRPAKCLKYTYESLKLSLATGNSVKASFAANNIGVIYQRYDSKQKAIEYFQIALENMNETNLGRVSLMGNLGELYLSLGKLDSASYYYQEALKYKPERECDLLSVYAGLIDINLRLEQVDTAREFNARGQGLVSTCKDSSNLFHYHYMAGRYLKQSGDLLGAKKNYLLAKAFGVNHEEGYKNLLKDLSDLEELQGNMASALLYAKEYAELSNKYYKAQYNREVARTDLEVAFQEEKDLLLANQESLEKDLSYFQDLRVVWSIASAFFLVAIIILWLSYRSRKKAAERLSKLNEVITHQKENLQFKTQQLADSNQKIKELSEFRERLAAMAVHDMKGPLSSIIGLADGEMSNRKQKLIKKAGQQMLNFLMDLLDIYKFEKANIALKLETHPIKGLIEEAYQNVDFLAEEKSIKLQRNIAHDLLVPVDEGIVVRVLTNLLSNAIKYSPNQSTVLVSAEVEQAEKQSFLLIKIQDQGRGISQENLKHMFEPMDNRKENYISKSTSTGIGFDFCKLAIQAHRGTITAESELEQGTTFLVRLPLNEIAHAQIKKSETEEQQKGESAGAHPESLERLAKSKIHEAGKILPILNELEEKGVDAKWVAKVKAAVFAADEIYFSDLIEIARNGDT